MSEIKFTEETVSKVAYLARMELTPAETSKFATQLGQILGYIEKLNELDTANVEPLTQVQEYATPLREDIVVQGASPESILACAPESVFENFKVPQVIASKDGAEG